MFNIKKYLQEMQQYARETRSFVAEMNGRLDRLEEAVQQRTTEGGRSIQERLDRLEEAVQQRTTEGEKSIQERLDRLEEAVHYHINFNDAKVLDVFIPNVQSYIDNEVFRRQGVLNELPQTAYFKQIHDLLKPYQAKDAEYIRGGRENDGGYVMVKPFSQNKIAYSLGICDDVSWDLQMAEQGYQVYQYDHTIDSLPEENDAFHWFKLGITGEEETEELKHLDTLISMNGHEDEEGMLLKADIEGFEWGMINQVPEDVLSKFDQIVMEIHNVVVGQNRDEIISALKKLTKTHVMVNIHANNNNNNKAFSGDLITADTMEITMLNKNKYDIEETEIIVPTVLDQPNDKNRPDISLGKW